jgi:hypothetical protein
MTVDVSAARSHAVTGGTGVSVHQAGSHVIVGTPVGGVSIHQSRLSFVLANLDVSVSAARTYFITKAPDEVVVTYVDTAYEPLVSDPEVSTEITVPAGVTHIRFKLWGASGGAGQGFAAAGTLVSGGGAHVGGTLLVSTGDILSIDVGRGGNGGNATTKTVGVGGWPNGTEGNYDLKHGSYGGGAGGASRLRLNGELMAEAGGSVGTAGFAGGGSAVPADVAYLHTNVANQTILFSEDDIMGGPNELDYPATRPSYGVLNTGPDGAPVRGLNGRSWVSWETP